MIRKTVAAAAIVAGLTAGAAVPGSGPPTARA